MSKKHDAGKAPAEAPEEKLPPVSETSEGFDSAKAALEKHAPGVELRSEGGADQNEVLVYSADGVDLLSRAVGSGSYTCLKDVPRCHAKAGAVHDLSHEPYDEQAAHAARDLAS